HQQYLKKHLINIKQTLTVQEYTSKFRNLSKQVEKIYEADKILNFIEGLKLATKAEISYCVSKSLEEEIHLATIFNTMIYNIGKIGHQVLRESKVNNLKINILENIETTPIELDKTKVKKFQGYKK
ncbi:13131_t:CDS:1, partial [Cetraspora pellucida]